MKSEDTLGPGGAPRTEGTLRVFCAVELPEGVRERVRVYAAGLRERFPHVRASWERPEKLHLTLKFLGEVEAARVEALARAAGRAAASVHAFDISITGTGAFPPRGAPRVLWLGVSDPEGGLARLQRRLEEECALEGFPREQRPFRPHLTVARLRTPAGVGPLADIHTQSEFDAPPFAVSELIVVRSELGPGGSRHTPLARHGLAAA